SRDAVAKRPGGAANMECSPFSKRAKDGPAALEMTRRVPAESSDQPRHLDFDQARDSKSRRLRSGQSTSQADQMRLGEAHRGVGWTNPPIRAEPSLCVRPP